MVLSSQKYEPIPNRKDFTHNRQNSIVPEETAVSILFAVHPYTLENPLRFAKQIQWILTCWCGFYFVTASDVLKGSRPSSSALVVLLFLRFMSVVEKKHTCFIPVRRRWQKPDVRRPEAVTYLHISTAGDRKHSTYCHPVKQVFSTLHKENFCEI